MRYRDERALLRDIKTRLFKPIYLLTGGDDYLKTTYRVRIIAAATERETSGFNLTVFSGERLDLNELFGALTTLPLMGGRRCVVVEDFFAERLHEDDLPGWEAILTDIPAETVLLLCQPTPPEKTKQKAAERFYKLIDKAGGAVATLNGRKGGDLVRFVVHHCEAAGATISTEAARHLIERVGDDMATLQSECDKLSAHAGGGEVTISAIDTLSPATIEADVYRMCRHLIAGDLQKALAILDDLWALRTPTGLIISALGSGLGDLYRAKVGQEKGRTQADIVADFEYRHEFRVRNALRDARPLQKAHIAGAMAAVLEADWLIKTTSIDDRTLLEQAVVRASAALRGRLLP
jgi:DNA polymerase-3 subunit delta